MSERMHCMSLVGSRGILYVRLVSYYFGSDGYATEPTLRGARTFASCACTARVVLRWTRPRKSSSSYSATKASTRAALLALMAGAGRFGRRRNGADALAWMSQRPSLRLRRSSSSAVAVAAGSRMRLSPSSIATAVPFGSRMRPRPSCSRSAVGTKSVGAIGKSGAGRIAARNAGRTIGPGTRRSAGGIGAGRAGKAGRDAGRRIGAGARRRSAGRRIGAGRAGRAGWIAGGATAAIRRISEEVGRPFRSLVKMSCSGGVWISCKRQRPLSLLQSFRRQRPLQRMRGFPPLRPLKPPLVWIGSSRRRRRRRRRKRSRGAARGGGGRGGMRSRPPRLCGEG